MGCDSRYFMTLSVQWLVQTDGRTFVHIVSISVLFYPFMSSPYVIHILSVRESISDQTTSTHTNDKVFSRKIATSWIIEWLPKSSRFQGRLRRLIERGLKDAKQTRVTDEIVLPYKTRRCWWESIIFPIYITWCSYFLMLERYNRFKINWIKNIL